MRYRTAVVIPLSRHEVILVSSSAPGVGPRGRIGVV